LLPKAIKNPVEVANIREAHIKDGVALTKFMYWLKQHVGKEAMTEISVADKMESFRKQQEHYLQPSFEPICGYAKHAAIVHYSATPETDAAIEAKGMLLMDTGAQYLEGTTDITRTFVVGDVTEEEKKFFTLVLKGNLNLGGAKFLHGCRGFNLDYLAREPLWQIGVDYNHGTGHGVGYLLNVHEGPNGFRWRAQSGKAEGCVLEEGMVTSNEPGFYLEDKFGIRHENLVVCRKAEKNAYGQFMCFETLTMVPFDLDGVEPSLLSEREKQLLNDYHKKIYDTIGPKLTEEERTWLAHATRAI
jgi:Xaa-Pro aminopeptidase